jgi:peptide/nickel transport system substrate-binding protein
MHRFSRRTALALAAGVVATACGGDDDEASSTTADDGAAAPASQAPQGTAAGTPGTEASAGTTPEGGSAPAGDEVPDISEYDLAATFRYQYSVGPSRFDAHKATSSFDNTSLFLTYDRLVHNAPDASAIPGLATEWEFNADGTALTFTLREGVTFHDGTPFDAAAVKANIERGQTVEGSAVASDLAVITSVDVVDPLTVTLNLGGSGAQLPLVLSDRPGMMISPAAFANPDLDQKPVGAGMFTVTEYRPNDRIVYTKYDGYWDPDAGRCAVFEYTISGDPIVRLNAIRTGAIDATFVDPPQEADAESAGLVSSRGTGLAYYHMQPNRSFEPFSKLEVRQAMNHAVDRKAIVDGLLLGLGNASGQVFPEGYFAYDEDTGTEPYPFDLEKARSLLEAAGHADGFEFEMIVPTIPNIQQLGEIVQAQLAEVGIRANIRQVEPAQTADIYYSKQEGQGLVSPWGGRPDPSLTLALMFGGEGFSNPGRHTTPEVQEAIDATQVVQSDEDRTAALKAASAAVVEAALDVPLYFPITPSVFTDRVIGWQTWLSGKPEFRYVGLKKA